MNFSIQKIYLFLDEIQNIEDWDLWLRKIQERKEIKIKILQSYYNTIFYKDLVERFKIDNLSLLDVFLKYNLENISKYLSISKTYNYLKSAGYKCSKQTLLNYLKYATEVFFLFSVEIFSYSLKNKGQYPKKVYVIDNGIVNAIYPEIKNETGKLMEHLVTTELVRESELFNKFEIYYWKEYGRQDGREIDFVIKGGLKVKLLIQVTYASARDEIEKRELRALVKASELLKCKNLLVIIWDYKGEEEFKGRKIVFIPLWKWLLKLN